MKIVAVDDDQLSLDLICELARQALPDANISRFQSAQEAYEYLSLGVICDVLFLEAETEGKTGLEFARRVRMSRPDLNLIFMNASPDYAAEAMELHASGYLLKPASLSAVKRELSDLRYQPGQSHGPQKRVRAQCFGNFELFVDGRAVRFKYNKTRELMAFLIDRCGAVCTGPEIAATLWEEDMEEHREYLKSLIRDLTQALSALGCENILEKQRGGLGVRPDLIDCDFYNWKRGLTDGLNTYRGEYMSQYSWGEFTNAGQLAAPGSLN